MNMYEKFFKRILDIIFAIIALPFFVAITVITAPLIFFEDRGSVFYVSKRAGKDGKIFGMLKFRSMKVNSENILNEDGSTYNSENDQRQTKVGKIIRRLSIDEIPQVLNILIGQMSWIGPRPVLDTQLATFTEEERGKLKVLPGLTGYSQAFRRNEMLSHDERMQDAWYADNVSIALDAKIVLKTIETLMHPERVYKN